MAAENPGKPPCHRPDAEAVLRRLRDQGHIAYFAGGCVRDLLLGLIPKDFDVATDAPPQRVRELFRNTQAVGASFGVILVRQGESMIEVATFREDDHYADGRHPSAVHFTTAQIDAQRRDFTINGLFLDPLTNQVIDYVGGQQDLAARRLRAIGNPAQRFHEDHLRLLRAVRFAARFDLTIDPPTAAAITTHADHLARISPERIADELRLLLTAPTRALAWRLLGEFRLAEVIFRHLDEKGPPGRDATVFAAVGSNEPAPFHLALAAAIVEYAWRRSTDTDIRTQLSDSAARRSVRVLRQSLKISNDESQALHETITGAGLLLADELPRVSVLKRFLARPTAPESRALLAAIAATVGWAPPTIPHETIEHRLTELASGDYAPPPYVTGDDLISAGLVAGPAFKRIIDEVYDAQLEDRLESKQAAMHMALQLAEQLAVGKR